MRFTYTEVEDALKELDDGVFFVREMNESDEKEYEICIRYIVSQIVYTYNILLYYDLIIINV